jgi:hypothetical protein
MLHSARLGDLLLYFQIWNQRKRRRIHSKSRM